MPGCHCDASKSALSSWRRSGPPSCWRNLYQRLANHQLLHQSVLISLNATIGFTKGTSKGFKK